METIHESTISTHSQQPTSDNVYEPELVQLLNNQSALAAKDISQMTQVEKMAAAHLGSELNSSQYQARTNQILEKYGDVCDPIPWQEFYDQKIEFQGTPIYLAGDKGRVFICMHGAGHSAMQFSILADQIKSENILAAFDFRGHGDHQMTDVEDFSLQSLSKDALAVVEHICELFKGKSVILVGHSMGAAVCLEVAFQIKENKLPFEDQLHGFINLDLVERTALKMLPKMDMILGKIPESFSSMSEAIDHRLSTKQLQNKIAARVSMPSEVKEVTQEDGKVVFKWKVQLAKTKPFWEQWFKGYWEKFCQVRLPNCVILADKDCHDDQFQLSWQNNVNSHIYDCKNSGHFIHQDMPIKIQLFFESFIFHNKIPVDCNEELTVTSLTGQVIKINRIK